MFSYLPFTICINIFTVETKYNVSKFANDAQISGNVSSVNDDVQKRQGDMDKLSELAIIWQLIKEYILLSQRSEKATYSNLVLDLLPSEIV